MVDQPDYIEIDCHDEIVFSNDFSYNIKKATISYVTQSYHNISMIIRRQHWFPQEIKNMSNYAVILHCMQNYPKQYCKIQNLYCDICEDAEKNEMGRLFQIAQDQFDKGQIDPDQIVQDQIVQDQIVQDQIALVNGPSVPKKVSNPFDEVIIRKVRSRKKSSSKKHSHKKKIVKSSSIFVYREIIDETKRNAGRYPYIDSVFPPNYITLATGWIRFELPAKKI